MLRFLRRLFLLCTTGLCLLTLPPAGMAAETRIAVAANFLPAAQKLADAFAAQSTHRIHLTSGASGKLYAQITHGAPFDALLSADSERPRQLERDGPGVAGSRFTYALGRLALWVPSAANAAEAESRLRQGRWHRLALANPRLAPYGAAAAALLTRLGHATPPPRAAIGENVAQALHFVASGNADAGLVALALLQARADGGGPGIWVVPAAMHPPVAQDAILLKRGLSNPATHDFLDWLKRPPAQALITAAGYALPEAR